MNFYERYQYLCGLKRLSPQSKEILDAIGVTSGTVSGWKNKGSIPNPEILTNIARYFDISTDYLLGLSDIPHFENTIEEMTELLMDSNVDVQSNDDYTGSGPEYFITYGDKTFTYQEHEYAVLCNKLKIRINDAELQIVDQFCRETFGGDKNQGVFGLSKEEQDLIDRYRKLNAEGKTMVNAAIIQEIRRQE